MRPAIITGQLFSSKKKIDILIFDSTVSVIDNRAFLNLHFWVFNYASYVRDALFDQWFYTQRLKFRPTSRQIQNYRNRSRYFKTDSQVGVTIILQYSLEGLAAVMSNRCVTLLSDEQGHVYHQIDISDSVLPEQSYIYGRFLFRDKEFTNRFLVNRLSNSINLYTMNGMTKFNERKPMRLLISDIDDTIKFSNVVDKKELLQNTFLNDYFPIEGIPEKYAELASTGVIDLFYYVSSSPWQLWPSLGQFLKDYQFPQSENLSLRKMVAKHISSLLYFLDNSSEYKIETINSIIQYISSHKLHESGSFPLENKVFCEEILQERSHFSSPLRLEIILVGDSGEKDPEIYNKIALSYPHLVKKIIIRNVPQSNFIFSKRDLGVQFLPDLLFDNSSLENRFSPEIWPLVQTYSTGFDFPSLSL